ncbi:cache domain-containing protein [Paenibacillus faecalis]|uniref:cache domain-containing protein n=1 Tax=Paenibacillus faecalis TaxID=2079532 RepID=UPI000D0E7AB5|nr:cache domain-containing protein [Paenibacillus faecalis]
MEKRKGFRLHTILGILVISSVVLTAFVGGYLAVSANIKSLTSNYLESNYQYARKLASNTTQILDLMQSNMDHVAQLAGDPDFSQSDLDVWFEVSEQYFNSIFIADANRQIKAVTPDQEFSLIGSQLTSKASFRAVDMKTPLISEPYIATTGRLILMISSPIYDAEGYYKGFAGGTIYLEENNVLSSLLREHFYGNGSYVYVVDDKAHLIFHPSYRRINQPITGNEVVRQVNSGQSGSAKVTNTEGKMFFAGYAYEPKSGWGIVSQTPVSVLYEPIKKLIWRIILIFLPICILILLAAWAIVRYISTPLYKLAKHSEDVVTGSSVLPSLPQLSSRIYELRQLDHSIRNYLSPFDHKTDIYSLSGPVKCNKLGIMIKECLDSGQPMALILVDMDSGNMHNNAIGDELMKYIVRGTDLFAECKDIYFRYSEERFCIVMENADPQKAADFADALRQKIDEQLNLSGMIKRITIITSTEKFAK